MIGSPPSSPLTKQRMPLHFRIGARITVRRICRTNDDARARDEVALLPPLEGQLPARSPRGILYTSCDDAYLARYGRDFLRSARENSPDQSLHLHLYDPAPATLAALETAATTGTGKLTFSWERLEQAPKPLAVAGGLYFVCVRFVRLWQLLEAARSPILAVDADAVVRNPLTGALGEHAREDIALFLRPNRPERRRVMGAAALVTPSELGRRFIRDCATTFVEYVRRGAKETTDQLILYLVWRWYQRHVAGFRCGTLTREFSDWKYDDASLIWHAKGGRRKATLPIDRLFGTAEAPEITLPPPLPPRRGRSEAVLG